MNSKIDTKSILIGLLAGVVVTLAVGAALPSNQQVGRYQVASGGEHSVIVDTVTGQAWRAGFNPNTHQTDGDFFKVKSEDIK